MRVISWFSCGAASAIATWLTPEAIPVYCDTASEHEDNRRFLADCEVWFGRSIVRLKSDEYRDTWDVWERRRYIAGIDGAPCTAELKIAPRLAFQRPDDVHVFGYTADQRDSERAGRLKANYPEMTLRFPLLDKGLTKESCHAMVERAGINLPVAYRLGFKNNNCRICPKATSPDYYALVRRHYPEDFARMAKLSRELDVRLCRIDGNRRFIDEILADHPVNDPIQPSCDFLCYLAEDEMRAQTEGMNAACN